MLDEVQFATLVCKMGAGTFISSQRSFLIGRSSETDLSQSVTFNSVKILNKSCSGRSMSSRKELELRTFLSQLPSVCTCIYDKERYLVDRMLSLRLVHEPEEITNYRYRTQLFSYLEYKNCGNTCRSWQKTLILLISNFVLFVFFISCLSNTKIRSEMPFSKSSRIIWMQPELSKRSRNARIDVIILSFL